MIGFGMIGSIRSTGGLIGSTGGWTGKVSQYRGTIQPGGAGFTGQIGWRGGRGEGNRSEGSGLTMIGVTDGA